MLVNIELERLLIGGVLLDGGSFPLVVREVEASSFSDAECRSIWSAAESLFVHNLQINVYTVSVQLSKMHKSVSLDRLIEYASKPVSVDDLVIYAKSVHELAVRRRYAEAASRIAGLVERSASVEMLAVESVAILVNIAAQERLRSGLRPLSEAALDHEKRRLAQNFEGSRFALTSFSPQFNAVARGYERGRVYTFAGRPGMGKTSWLLTEFVHQARAGKRVVFFELEMMEWEIIDAAAAILSNVPYSNIERNRFGNEAQFRAYQSASAQIASWKHAYIDCSASITPSYLLQTCLMLKHQIGGLDGVFVDYIGLMNSDDRKELNRDRIAAVTRMIKAHAKTLDAPIIQAAQLSRASEMRGSSARPQMSDLAESGTIEQDSDAIFALWRDENVLFSPSQPGDALTQIACLKLRYANPQDFAVVFRGAVRGFAPDVPSA